MWVKRKQFSSFIDETTGEEKYFSTTEFVPYEEYQSEFSATGQAVKEARALRKASKDAWVKANGGRNYGKKKIKLDEARAGDLNTKINFKGQQSLTSGNTIEENKYWNRRYQKSSADYLNKPGVKKRFQNDYDHGFSPYRDKGMDFFL